MIKKKKSLKFSDLQNW